MSRAKALTRGDRRRNERLVRLRSIVRRDYAIVAVDLASAKQAAVVADHDRALPRLVDTGSGGLCRLSELVLELDGGNHTQR